MICEQTEICMTAVYNIPSVKQTVSSQWEFPGHPIGRNKLRRGNK